MKKGTIMSQAAAALSADTDADAIASILSDGPVIPVIVIEDVAHAVPLAQALVAGGVRVLEVTLRTEAALESIRRIRAEVPDAIVGAGTVLTPANLQAVAAVGAAFAVSPGATPTLLDAAAGSPVPLLPGTATASEVMAVLERGYTYMKLFPAEAAGGVALLSSLASPLPAARFCPTGGIDPEKAKRYLALPNVVCVGGSWLVPRQAVKQGDWERITELARASLGLKEGRA
jgi:2-dehydro-3-deoxyphosphogluconate aldolase/(4S)-4-hydroxy-2-oxoglutarate aldolase